ncbi:DNA-binding protein [Nocardia cyriacigeorgica]|uniref:DNA-binding protein n=1 Tax=Nocardia cyriacigeorgica TaxID=135487 RepID=UPI002456A2B8|nr:DNA-binding protein [Nocardia cyriacigeorgica]
MVDDRLTPRQLAERWGMTEHSLAQWRYLRKGPNYIRAGRKVLYPLPSVLDFERQNTVTCSGAA